MPVLLTSAWKERAAQDQGFRGGMSSPLLRRGNAHPGSISGALAACKHRVEDGEQLWGVIPWQAGGFKRGGRLRQWHAWVSCF